MRLVPTPGRQRAFTLVELAVVLAIVGLLLGSLMYTLSAQVDQRAREETQRRLEQAREALLGYAVAHGRLPCPAADGATGIESPAGGSDCTNYRNGFLPAITLGFQPLDDDGYAVDAWNNRIRYAVARNLNTASCIGTSTVPHFTVSATLKQNGMSCLPHSTELLICKSSATSPTPVPGNCGPASNTVTNSNPSGSVVAVIFSTGKNYAAAPTAVAALAAAKPDEAANLDNNAIFIARTPSPGGVAGGEFDDMVVWISVGSFYGRLATAAILP